MMTQWCAKAFAELSTEQLYQILQLRQQVFVVEQDCVYLDADGLDQQALHLFAMTQGQVVACCRVLPPGVKYPEPSIGRVCTAQTQRRSGLGRELMQTALTLCAERYPSVRESPLATAVVSVADSSVRISAQLYLQNFYASFGFITVSDVYDEDGIPHIEMLHG